ncbi:MAG: 2-succinyl-5-enolpyruvyl-6-hydroxy-3-cyclohexene-1-carboxylic-acid synthase [Deltaproteobacteria bacterium]|nr:2-succinyl-5-enolpyruvyl-6-hydroxy-3-cyclohexene-1-carboxylic-acid synthase [Deltaproteobacteria bacterium]
MTRPISMQPGALPAKARTIAPAGLTLSATAAEQPQPDSPGYQPPFALGLSGGRAANAPEEAGDLARHHAHVLLGALERSGLRQVVISSGSRSTPLVLAAAERAAAGGLVLHDIVDERSAAFFALGLARASGEAPALICTSGSAAAHYHPAVLEAAHAELPLLVISADRPPEAQGRGAHQTIDQGALFREVCRATHLLGLPDPHPDAMRGVAHLAARALFETRAPRPGPVHVVAPFCKPLEPTTGARAMRLLDLPPPPRFFAGAPRPAPEALELLAARCRQQPRGLIVAGALRDLSGPARDALWRLAKLTGYPVAAEAGSQLRLDGEARDERIDHFPALLARGIPAELEPRLILRLGAEPSPLGFAAWLGRLESEVWLLGEGFAADGENRCAGIVEGSLGESLAALETILVQEEAPDSRWLERWRAADRQAGEQLARVLARGVLDEAATLRTVLEHLPAGAELYLGNSLTLRMADLCGSGALARCRVHTQRGTSGIDGTVAGAAGVAAASGRPVVCVLGDLSLAHDLGSLGLAARSAAPVTIVVANNGGGRIFELLPAGTRAELSAAVEQHLVMPGARSFEQAAAHFGLAYHRVEDRAALAGALSASGGSRLVEAVVPAHAARDFLAALRDRSA